MSKFLLISELLTYTAPHVPPIFSPAIGVYGGSWQLDNNDLAVYESHYSLAGDCMLGGSVDI